jgi:hypothetical protein
LATVPSNYVFHNRLWYAPDGSGPFFIDSFGTAYPLTGGGASITGNNTVGSVLTCTVDSSLTGTATYQWRKDGANISGATSNTYTITAFGAYDCVVNGTVITTSALTVAGIVPGAVTAVTAGTATGSTQPLSWTAPGTGSTPITYTVGYRLRSVGGSYTTAAFGVSGTSYTVTGLAASTAYDYSVLPVNSTGTGTAGLLANVATAASDTFPAKSFYYQDLTGIADGTLVRTLTGWNAWDGSGTVTAASARDNLRVYSNQFGFTGSEYNTQPGAALIGYDYGSADLVVRFRVRVISTGGEQNICISSLGPASSLYVNLMNNGGVGLLLIRSNNVTLGSINLTTSQLGRQLATGDLIEVRTPPGEQRVHVYVNTLRVTPAVGIDIGSYVKGTRVGYGTFNTGSEWRTDDFYVAALAGNIKIVSPDIFVSGTVADGGRFLPVAGTYIGTVLALDYRVLNSDTQAVIADWQRMSGATISGGAWSSTVLVPMSDTTTNPRCVLQVRAANDTDVYDTTTAFAVGLSYLFWGQSNSAFRDASGATVPAGGNSNAYAFAERIGGYVWHRDVVAGTTHDGMYGMGHAFATATGIPAGMLITGIGSQTIDNLVPSGTVTFADSENPGQVLTGWQILQRSITRSNVGGLLAGMCWTQGEAEAFQTARMVTANYKSKYAELKAGIAPYMVAGAPITLALIGKYTSTPTDIPAFNADSDDLRRTLFELARDVPGTYMAHSFVDLPHAAGDSFHYTPDSYYQANRRAGLTFAKLKGSIAYDGQGPIVTGVTRSGATITLTVNLNGATSFAGTGLGGYDVSTDDFTTLKTVSSAAVSGSTIVLTLSADPGAAVKVRSFAGYDFGTPTMAIGTYADGTTIATMPISLPLVSN